MRKEKDTNTLSCASQTPEPVTKTARGHEFVEYELPRPGGSPPGIATKSASGKPDGRPTKLQM
jgi:hypothetical protein